MDEAGTVREDVARVGEDVAKVEEEPGVGWGRKLGGAHQRHVAESDLTTIHVDEADRLLNHRHRGGLIHETHLVEQPREAQRLAMACETRVPLAPVPARVEREVRAARAELTFQEGEEARRAAAKVAALDDGEGLRLRQAGEREHRPEGSPVARVHVGLARETPLESLHQRIGRDSAAYSGAHSGCAGGHEGMR